MALYHIYWSIRKISLQNELSVYNWMYNAEIYEIGSQITSVMSKFYAINLFYTLHNYETNVVYDRYYKLI